MEINVGVMSNDLISRKALISHIESQYRQWGEDYDTEQILGDIEDFPTAYDVDKVAKRLKNEMLEDIIANNYCEKCKYRKKCDELEVKHDPKEDFCDFVAKHLATEIVKAGMKG